MGKKKNLIRTSGHKKGATVLNDIISTCYVLEIPYVSVYAFSTENWQRPKEEVSFLMSLLKSTIKKELDKFIENKIKVRFIGSWDAFSPDLVNEFKHAEKATKDNNRLQINIMANYGARSEIVHGINTLLQTKPSLDSISEEDISNALFTKGIPDPDLLIRTSGEIRLSNFMLWQCAYTEFFFHPNLMARFFLKRIMPNPS